MADSKGLGRLYAIQIDVADLERGATFWGMVLGEEAASNDGTYLHLTASGGRAFVSLQKVPEAKSAIKNRVHLDVAVPDVEAAMKRVEALGGKQLRAVDPEGGFIVAADPDGNEFCLVPEE